MIVMSIKQHLNNIWSSIHEKVKQHWGWVEKKHCLQKACISATKSALSNMKKFTNVFPVHQINTCAKATLHAFKTCYRGVFKTVAKIELF